ncbi:BA75_01817T0 [Komagataella pastoris]|uniref:BA75_01817T0 n=1 Tax=Komagataella pastoris TaxID=4922 RepID=A0A1B2J884_PICPA|nr:BA75_01817T0 [Komagataella pastoris]
MPDKHYRDYQQVIKLNVADRIPRSRPSLTSAPSPDDCMPILPMVAMDSTKASDYKIVKRRKIVRTKTGCFCCRKRKKKCDEIRPKCSGCSRNFLVCTYPSEAALESSQQKANSNSDCHKKRPNIMIIQDDPTKLITRNYNSFVITSISSNRYIQERSSGPTAPIRSISIKSLLN